MNNTIKLFFLAPLFIATFFVQYENNIFHQLQLHKLSLMAPVLAFICAACGFVISYQIHKKHTIVMLICFVLSLLMNIQPIETSSSRMLDQTFWCAILVVFLYLPTMRRWLEI